MFERISMKQICIVEDEIDLSDILDIYLRREGWMAHPCQTLEEARGYLDKNIDVWVLDLMLPDGNGYELLKEIKAIDKTTPCIVISARGDSIDRVLGFEMGCDDYIAKPFMPQELVFRIKAFFNQNINTNINSTKPTNKISVGDCVIDLYSHLVLNADEEEIVLTTKEYDLLSYLVTHTDKILTRKQIMQEAWGDEYLDTPRSVDNFIKRLRAKVPGLKIETVYGVGYRCVE